MSVVDLKSRLACDGTGRYVEESLVKVNRWDGFCKSSDTYPYQNRRISRNIDTAWPKINLVLFNIF